MTTKNTDLAAKTSQELEEVPEFLKNVTTARGTENIEATDMVLPRIAVCQSGTPQRKTMNIAFIKGLEEGDFFNTLSRTIYGKTIHIIPLFFYKSRIYFKGIDDGGGILCQAPDGVHCQLNNGGPCLHQTWSVSGDRPECTEFFNFASLVRLEGQPMEFGVLSLKSTGIKAAKELNSFIRLSKKDAFARVYLVETFPDNKQNQDFFNVRVSNAGFPTEAQYKYAEQQYLAIFPKIKSGEVTMDTSGLGEETESDRQFADRDAEGSEL